VANHVAATTGAGFELEHKGGLVVGSDAAALPALHALAATQRAAGVDAIEVPAASLPDHEPHLAPDVAGGVLYPQDAQLQPMLAAARMLQAARQHGAEVRTGVAVTGFLQLGLRVNGVRTSAGDVSCRAVINAAGTWGGEVSRLAGVALPILPRRGVVLVTQPLPPLIRHKVYAAEYVADVASDEAGLESSAVVEGTRAGTVLVGASRERAGFHRGMRLHVVQRLAAQAVRLFPVLGGVALLRTYAGFRPYCPDHLPVVGPDPRAPGLLHACGHEGAGVGLAAATGHLLAQHLVGARPDLDLTPFRPDRFTPASMRGTQMWAWG
jgi:glycine/D-amino acid oxidase-like deaminating enzyme